MPSLHGSGPRTRQPWPARRSSSPPATECRAGISEDTFSLYIHVTSRKKHIIHHIVGDKVCSSRDSIILNGDDTCSPSIIVRCLQNIFPSMYNVFCGLPSDSTAAEQRSFSVATYVSVTNMLTWPMLQCKSPSRQVHTPRGPYPRRKFRTYPPSAPNAIMLCRRSVRRSYRPAATPPQPRARWPRLPSELLLLSQASSFIHCPKND